MSKAQRVIFTVARAGASVSCFAATGWPTVCPIKDGLSNANISKWARISETLEEFEELIANGL